MRVSNRAVLPSQNASQRWRVRQVMPSYKARMLPTVSLVHGGADQSFAIHTLEKQKQDIHPPLSTLNILYDSLLPLPDLFSNFIAALGRSSRSHMAGVVELLVAMVLESQLSSGISLCATFLYLHTFPSSLWSRKYGVFSRYSTSIS